MGKYSARRDLDLDFKKCWYLFANRAEAVIYSDHSKRDLAFVERFENPDARLREIELTSDRPGRSHSAASNARHGFDPNTTHHEGLAIDFAHQLGLRLERAYRDERYTSLVIAAEPHFLGLMRIHFPSSLKSVISQEIHGDYVRQSPAQLWENLKRAG